MIAPVPRCLAALGLSLLVGISLARAQAADDIVLGMSAAFKGPSRGLSIELYRGSLAYLEHINQSGGVHGKAVRIKAYDDGYNPRDAIDNTIQLVEQDKVFLLYGYMGSPTVTRILPLLKKYEDLSVYLFCPFTGAEPHRRYPYDRYVYNLRASYRQETAGLVERFCAIGRKRLAVFYQIDAYGRSGWDGVRRRLDRHGLTIVAEATYARGTPYGASFRPQVELLRQANPDAIISVGTYSASAGFIRDVRDAGWTDVPIANISGVDSDNLLQLLTERGRATGTDYTQNLINSEVVPSYHDTTLPAVQEYRKLMDLHRPLPPADLLDEEYHAPRYSFISFEGYLNARLVVEVLRRVGPDLQRELIRDAVESIQGLDLGIDRPGAAARAAFGRDRHQGLDQVYFAAVADGRFVPLPPEGWERWRR